MPSKLIISFEKSFLFFIILLFFKLYFLCITAEKCSAVALADALPQSLLMRSPYCGKNVVKVEDIHTERLLVVPNTEPNIHPVYFDKAEFCRLAKQSKVNDIL